MSRYNQITSHITIPTHNTFLVYLNIHIFRPGPEQQDAVFAIAGGIVLGTILCVQLLNGLESALPKDFSCFMRDYPLPILLGVIFVAAGSSHFTMTNAFCNIVPYRGCWGGLWQVGSIEFLGLDYEEFHTVWTGIAEIAGGLFLIFSVFGIVDVSPTVPAALLGTLVSLNSANIFSLTRSLLTLKHLILQVAAITPANIFVSWLIFRCLCML